MMTIILSLLMALGLLSSPEEFDQLSTGQQNELIEIVIDDVGNS